MGEGYLLFSLRESGEYLETTLTLHHQGCQPIIDTDPQKPETPDPRGDQGLRVQGKHTSS